MKLYDICPEAQKNGIENLEINSVTDDTRKLSKGDIFVCIKGGSFDGHDAAPKMIAEGAAMVVAERDTGVRPQLIVPDTRKYLSLLAANYFGNPQKKLKMIGVTGTNGKTTVAHIVRHIVEKNGERCALIGTAGIDLCGTKYPSDKDIPTTPKPMELFSFLAEAVKNGASYCSIEASSQALAQQRLFGVHFAAAIFTNLTQDHLDFHGTMEKYYQAKKILFSQCDTAIINVDDKYGERLYDEISCNKTAYSAGDAADYYSVNIKTDSTSVSYWLSSAKAEKSFPIKFGMPGVFNVYNSLAAAAACCEAGMDISRCAEALESFSGVRGRCEVIYSGKFTVICDYAHTADALEKILKAVKAFAEGKIICLFGAAGERDAEKRPDMGIVVGKNADMAILTSDNPRFEDPMKIIKDVEKGLDKTMIKYKSIEDRREAIEYALSAAGEKDIVLLCGKGHENYQVYKDDYRHFDEHEIVKEILG